MRGIRSRCGWRRRTLAMLAIAGFAALGVVAMPLSSAAVNFASFQLDGNTTGDDDWDALYPSSSVFTQDGSGSGDDQLVQGTADKLDFDRWTWRSQAVTPPKSDIQWAYATPAVVNNELVLYFGSDRANDDKAGSVNVGFWFLQGDVGPQSGGSFGPDRHKPGDVFVAAEIDSGGRVANIAVYKWDPGASKNLALQTSGSYGECDGTVVFKITIRPHVSMLPPTMSWPAASTENDERVFERKLEKQGGAPLNSLLMLMPPSKKYGLATEPRHAVEIEEELLAMPHATSEPREPLHSPYEPEVWSARFFEAPGSHL